MKKLSLIIFLTTNLLASPIEVKKDKTQLKNQPQSNKGTKKPTLKRNTKLTESNNEDIQEVKKLDQNNNLELKHFLSRNALGIWDLSNKFDIKTGTAIKGIILNSIVSSNLESPLLVESTETMDAIPQGSKFSCVGITKNKRVLAFCNRLITETDEYDIDTILLNNDGTAGLLGKSYSGKEQYAVGAITASAIRGALDVSLDRVNSPLGTETISTSAKNKIKSGGIGALDEIVQMNADEFKTQEPKISIDAGKEVLIYFNRRFKL
jgi:hypothetical protein